ncbi:MAG TPA: hypothetical protein VM450_09875 [Thermomicrobiales bacterium]|nr:hypothetical protein [Thermomicrobiales bacterium]
MLATTALAATLALLPCLLIGALLRLLATAAVALLAALSLALLLALLLTPALRPRLRAVLLRAGLALRALPVATLTLRATLLVGRLLP